MDVIEEKLDKIFNERIRRENQTISSKLYARCDLCGKCFKLQELTILVHEERHTLHDSPSELFKKWLTEAETMQIVCRSCLKFD
jgi:hypothetical protein